MIALMVEPVYGGAKVASRVGELQREVRDGDSVESAIEGEGGGTVGCEKSSKACPMRIAEDQSERMAYRYNA